MKKLSVMFLLSATILSVSSVGYAQEHHNHPKLTAEQKKAVHECRSKCDKISARKEKHECKRACHKPAAASAVDSSAAASVTDALVSVAPAA